MSKMSELSHEMDVMNTFSAWSADGETEVQMEGQINPDRLVGDDVPDYKSGGSIVYLEEEEIQIIKKLSKIVEGRSKRVLELLYERIK